MFGDFGRPADVLSFFILFLEYGVLNFGDSDLPPYQPDTWFETVGKIVWITATIGAVFFWVFTIFYTLVVLCGILKRGLSRR